MTTVQAFYMALGAADGEEASKFLVPEKRNSRALSARAITTFYSKLIVPLALVDIIPLGGDRYRVRYGYVASGARMKLIESIKSSSDC
jgi:hypothetical protein